MTFCRYAFQVVEQLLAMLELPRGGVTCGVEAERILSFFLSSLQVSGDACAVSALHRDRWSRRRSLRHEWPDSLAAPSWHAHLAAAMCCPDVERLSLKEPHVTSLGASLATQHFHGLTCRTTR